jgi:hypothetical protein
VNALEALRQIQSGKGFSIRGKALVREHGRSIGIVHFVIDLGTHLSPLYRIPGVRGQCMKGV